MNLKEQNQWIDELLDGTISEADFLRLEAVMRVDPDARQSYYQRIKLYHLLQSENSRLVTAPTPVYTLWRHSSKWISIAAAVLLFGLTGFYSWKLGQGSSANTTAVSEPVAKGYAILVDHSNAKWSNVASLQRGELLPEGLLVLESGVAQLEFFSGVMVIAEGPAQFKVDSPMEMTVSNGKIRALVPDAARGFKVSTSSGEVIDLGTEFALDVSEDQAEMHVLQGEIEWHASTQEVKRLQVGESMRWSQAGESLQVETDTRAIPGLGEFEQQFLAQKRERENTWRVQSHRLARDTSALAFYPVQQDSESSRQLLDETSSRLNGTIVRARRVADRWGQEGGALNFSPAGSRVRVYIPGEYQSLTFYCWVRIDSLDRLYNSLFLTDGHELNEPHWQIMNDGRLFFSVKRRDRTEDLSDKHIAYSPSFWDPSLSGQWFQIATVFDAEAQTTTHYVNGKMISRDHIAPDYQLQSVKIGSASIGNWNEPTRQDAHFALRNLNGAIDEFAIFARTMNAEEIAKLFEAGRP